jgi:hypothetical protein
VTGAESRKRGAACKRAVQLPRSSPGCIGRGTITGEELERAGKRVERGACHELTRGSDPGGGKRGPFKGKKSSESVRLTSSPVIR